MGVPVSKTQPYTGSFYDAIRSGSQSSAAVIVPLVIGHLGAVESVVDVGCGEGWWGHEFTKHLPWSITALGIDGEYVETCAIPMEAVDLGQPFDLGRRFDVAVCLEVAEHLPPERADGFVADLCRLAPTVVFSAAMPRQGGVGHVNLEPPSYWASLFRGQGFGWEDPIRRRVWQSPSVEPWYASNLLVFREGAGRMEGDPDWLIHPKLWLTPRS